MLTTPENIEKVRASLEQLFKIYSDHGVYIFDRNTYFLVSIGIFNAKDVPSIVRDKIKRQFKTPLQMNREFRKLVEIGEAFGEVRFNAPYTYFIRGKKYYFHVTGNREKLPDFRLQIKISRDTMQLLTDREFVEKAVSVAYD
jgi:hypothetical protein